MKKNIIFFKNIVIIRNSALFALRLKMAVTHVFYTLKSALVWLFRSREFTNFTYDLTPLNKKYLAAFVSEVTGKNIGEISGYIEELEKDEFLRNHIHSATMSSARYYASDAVMFYGRRLGWYAIARAIKPKVIIETGVDKGLGSCILAAALMQNEKEGFLVYYYGTDINPDAGYLLTGVYKKYGKILYGDSITSLASLEHIIDIFINDSDHSAEYENQEYLTIANKINEKSIILGDNAHVDDVLLNFALQTNRRFSFFREQPLNHWYSGAGIGAAY